MFWLFVYYKFLSLFSVIHYGQLVSVLLHNKVSVLFVITQLFFECVWANS